MVVGSNVSSEYDDNPDVGEGRHEGGQQELEQEGEHPKHLPVQA